MSDAPTIKEELERKVSTALADIIKRVDEGVLPAEAAREGCQALWDASSGLIDHDIMDLIAETIDAFGQVEINRRVIWRKGNGKIIALLTAEKDRPEALILSFVPKDISKSRIGGADASIAEVAGKTNQFLSGLAKAGFVPLNL